MNQVDNGIEWKSQKWIQKTVDTSLWKESQNHKWKWKIIIITPPLLVGLQTGTTALEINLKVPLKIANISTWRPTYISVLGICPKDAPPCHVGTCCSMFIEAFHVIARNWKQHRCSTIEEWIQKMWFIYRMEYYPAISMRTSWLLQGNGWN